MYDQEIPASQVKADRFPFPCEGDITLAVRNKNYALGPVMVHIVMKPGSVIPAHKHDGMAEALYVMEGDFINEGKEYLAGTSVHVKAGRQAAWPTHYQAWVQGACAVDGQSRDG